MNQFQKTIKYLAMAFAIFLTCVIIYLTLSTIGFLVGVFNFGENWVSNNEKNNSNLVSEENFTATYDDIKKIEIKHGVGRFTIKSADTNEASVHISGSEDYYKVTNFDNTLKVENKSNFRRFFDFGFRERSLEEVELTIYLPENYELKDLDIRAGAGEIVLEDFDTQNLNIEAGAGRISITNVVADYSDIDGGVGELNFRDVEFNSGDIDSGVGRLNFSGKLHGKHTIDAGVGEINLDIKGKIDDYDLSIDKGLGGIKINGKAYKDINTSKSETSNSLHINGGLGNINIDFWE